MSIAQHLATDLVSSSMAVVDKAAELERLLDEIQKTSVEAAAQNAGEPQLEVSVVHVKQCSDLMRELGVLVNDANAALRKVRKDTLSKLPKGTDTKLLFGTPIEQTPSTEENVQEVVAS